MPFEKPNIRSFKILHEKEETKRALLKEKLQTRGLESLKKEELNDLISIDIKEMQQRLLRMHYLRSEVKRGAERTYKKLFDLYQNYVVFLQWFVKLNPILNDLDTSTIVEKYSTGIEYTNGSINYRLKPSEYNSSPFIKFKTKEQISKSENAVKTYFNAKLEFIKLRDNILEEYER